MRTPCKYAHEVTYVRWVNDKIRDITVNECWAEKEPFECSDKNRELCRMYKPANKSDALEWFNTGHFDEWYGHAYKCAKCGYEVCARDARNYCPNCGYEYEPWDGTVFK